MPSAWPAPDAPLVGQTTVGRGGRCTTDADCGELTCLAMPAGYCGTPCSLGVCDGTCVETMRDGELCLAACTRDAECRSDEGYVCDPQWHACTIPNTTALVPRSCPAAGPRQDGAFEASEPWGIGRSPSGVPQAQSFVALYASGSGINVLAEHDAALTTGGRDPWLARGRKLYGVWRDAEAVELASSDDGRSWSAPTPVQAASDPLGKPMIAVGPKEIIYVMYGGGRDGLRVRASRDGGKTFGTPVTALAGAAGATAVGVDGRLHVVTLNGDDHGSYGSAQQQIEYTVSADSGATFAKPSLVSRREEQLPTYFANPSLAIDDQRKLVYVAYVRGGRDGVWDLVIAASKDGGTTWTRTTIGDGCSFHLVPSLAVDPTTGTLHLTWYDTAGAPGRYVHATCGAGAARCTPWGAINTTPFETFTLGRATRTSVGDYQSLFVDDKRRVLHVLWTQPMRDPMTGQLVPRVFHATAKLKK